MIFDAIDEAIDRLAPMDSPILLGPNVLLGRELFEQSAKLAAWLVRRGLVAGDHLGIGTRLDPDVFIVFVACLRAGIAPLFIDAGSKKHEVEALLLALSPRMILVDPDLAKDWGLARAGAQEVVFIERRRATLASRLLGTALRGTSYPACFQGDPPFPRRREPPPEEIGLFLYTSGTTGAPKLVPLSRQNLVAQVEVMAKGFGFDRQTRLQNLMSRTHVDGLVTGVLLAVFCGSLEIRLGAFSIPALPAYLEAIARHRATHLIAPPTVLELLLRLGPGLGPAFASSDYRYTISTASPLSAELWERFEAASERPVINLYGMTEIGNVFFSGPDLLSRKIGSIGLPLGCEVLILDPADHVLGEDEAGELLVSGPTVVGGYFSEHPNREPGTSPEVVMNGRSWFRTGDLARREPSGHFQLLGRKKELIIVGGLNVFPSEVDPVISSLESVKECTTVGVPDPTFGERVVTFVVRSDASLSENVIFARAKERLSEHKVPREIVFVDALERGRSGKVKQESLLAAYAARRNRATGQEEEIAARIFALASEAFRVPVATLSLTTTPEVCHSWDSMAHLDLSLRIEAAFGITLGPADIMSMTSLARAVEIAKSKRAA